VPPDLGAKVPVPRARCAMRGQHVAACPLGSGACSTAHGCRRALGLCWLSRRCTPCPPAPAPQTSVAGKRGLHPTRRWAVAPTVDERPGASNPRREHLVACLGPRRPPLYPVSDPAGGEHLLSHSPLAWGTLAGTRRPRPSRGHRCGIPPGLGGGCWGLSGGCWGLAAAGPPLPAPGKLTSRQTGLRAALGETHMQHPWVPGAPGARGSASLRRRGAAGLPPRRGRGSGGMRVARGQRQPRLRCQATAPGRSRGSSARLAGCHWALSGAGAVGAAPSSLLRSSARLRAWLPL